MKAVKASYVIAGLIILAIIGLASGGVYTDNDRERGVILHNGKQAGIAEPGLNWKLPILDSVEYISIQNQSMVFNKLSAYSKDKQTAELRVSVSYHISPTDVGRLYSEYTSLQGIEQRLIARHVPAKVENVFGKYDAPTVIESRTQFGIDVAAAIKEAVVGAPVVIDSVQVENIDFDDSYEASIKEQMQKSVAVSTQTYETSRQVQTNLQKVNQAKAEADSNLALATAEAQATRLKGEADAYAIEVKAKALASNQNLVELTKSERWDGKLPTHMIPGQTLPFMEVGKK